MIVLRKLTLVFLLFGTANFYSCRSQFSLISNNGSTIEINQVGSKGKWDAIFDRAKICRELTNLSEDTIATYNVDLGFRPSESVNNLDSKGRRKGIWISYSSNSFSICNYKSGKKHGMCIYLTTEYEISIFNYKNGMLHGLSEKKIGEASYSKRWYKEGKIIKQVIQSPKW